MEMMVLIMTMLRRKMNEDRISQLEMKCINLEKQLSDVEDKYNKLCTMVRKQANRLRPAHPNVSDETDDFLFNNSVDQSDILN
jgi:hypothetical protein